jgi:hypothetical protein
MPACINHIPLESRLIIKIGFLVLFLSAISRLVIAQDRFVIPELSGEIDFNGSVDEPAWESIPPLPMVQNVPVFGKEPSEKTEVRVTYNNEFIFVSARMYDQEASEIMSTSKKRDEISAGNDWFTIIFDSFNDKENGLAFATTPSGLRTDFTVFKDGIVQLPDMPFNLDWNTFWDVKTTRDDRGWYLEMRIPVTSLRFKENGGEAVMGMTCFRQIAHKNETIIFPAISPDRGIFAIYRPSQSREVVFRGIHSRKPFYIAPFVIGGFQQENLLNDAETKYDEKVIPTLSAGIDAKYGLTNNLTLDVTVNTDFAQVEADDQQINLTRFSLFFPEKRSFFQERASIFSFDFDQGNSMFYSRRIGLSGGEKVPIYGGARITGMAGKWDIGLLDMQTRKFDSDLDNDNDLPSENFGILRMRRNIINPNSYVGGMAVSRMGNNGHYNIAYGADANIKMFGDDYINIKIAQVMDDSAINKAWSVDPTQIYLNWKRYRNKGFGYDFVYSRSGGDYNPEAGFKMRDNYALYGGSLNYGWLHGESSAIINDGIELNAKNYFSFEAGETESLIFSGGYFLVLKSSMFSYAGLNHQYENVADSFSFSDDAVVPPGKYWFDLFEYHGQTPETKSFYFGLDMLAGSFYDGNRFSVTVQPYWNISPSLKMSAEYTYDRLRFSDRRQRFDGHIARLRTLLMFTTRLSMSAFIQYSSADQNMLANLRLRFNPKEGNDFYIVYNEGRNTSLDQEIPRMPSLSDRAIFVKYTYTFSVR